MEPITPSTDKKTQTLVPLTFGSSAPSSYPFAYVDNLWDVVREGSNLAQLTEAIGQFDQHTINELLATLILQIITLITPPATHGSFNQSFSRSFERS